MNGLHEDKVWLKSIYPNFKKGKQINLCDHDFHLKKYLSKFVTHSKSIAKNSSGQRAMAKNDNL